MTRQSVSPRQGECEINALIAPSCLFKQWIDYAAQDLQNVAIIIVVKVQAAYAQNVDLWYVNPMNKPELNVLHDWDEVAADGEAMLLARNGPPIPGAAAKVDEG